MKTKLQIKIIKAFEHTIRKHLTRECLCQKYINPLLQGEEFHALSFDNQDAIKGLITSLFEILYKYVLVWTTVENNVRRKEVGEGDRSCFCYVTKSGFLAYDKKNRRLDRKLKTQSIMKERT